MTLYRDLNAFPARDLYGTLSFNCICAAVLYLTLLAKQIIPSAASTPGAFGTEFVKYKASRNVCDPDKNSTSRARIMIICAANGPAHVDM